MDQETKANTTTVHYIFGYVFGVIFLVAYTISGIKAYLDRKKIKARIIARQSGTRQSLPREDSKSKRNLYIIHDNERELRLKQKEAEELKETVIKRLCKLGDSNVDVSVKGDAMRSPLQSQRKSKEDIHSKTLIKSQDDTEVLKIIQEDQKEIAATNEGNASVIPQTSSTNEFQVPVKAHKDITPATKESTDSKLDVDPTKSASAEPMEAHGGNREHNLPDPNEV